MDLIVEFLRRLFSASPQPPPAFSPFDYHNEVGMMFYSALMGAIIGAVVGGVVQAFISKMEYNRHKADEAAAKLEMKKAQALRTIAKAIKIAMA